MILILVGFMQIGRARESWQIHKAQFKNFLKTFSKEILIKISSYRPNLTALMSK